jgi:hypothetical protein
MMNLLYKIPVIGTILEFVTFVKYMGFDMNRVKETCEETLQENAS